MVELLDGLVSPGGPVGIGEADQLSAPRMQLRRHLVGGQCLRHPDFATVTPQKTAIPWYREIILSFFIFNVLLFYFSLINIGVYFKVKVALH